MTIDTDGDDLADCTEFSLQTEPHNPDTDGDDLTDGEEVLTHETDPRDPDSDDGGVEDGDEVALGTDPLDPTDDLRKPIATTEAAMTSMVSWTIRPTRVARATTTRANSGR